MPHDRFYLDAPLEEGDAVSIIDPAELHHLLVSRARVGEQVELVNGKGKCALATVEELGKRKACLHIDSVSVQQKPPREIILAQGLPRMGHLEWIIEKGTELGVSAFWLFPGTLSEKSDLSANQKSRLNHLAVAAMKQCGRWDLPEILIKPPLAQWEPLSGTLLCATLSPEAPYLWTLSKATSPLVLFVGPESGFTAQELAHMQDRLHAQPVRLHPNTLRTETASLTGLVLLQTILIEN